MGEGGRDLYCRGCSWRGKNVVVVVLGLLNREGEGSEREREEKRGQRGVRLLVR